MAVQPARQPPPHRLARLAAQAVREHQLERAARAAVGPGSSRPIGAGCAACRPQDAALRIEREGVVGRRDQGPGAAPDLGPEDAPRRRAQRPALGILAARLELVAQPLDPADRVAVDQDRAVLLDRRERRAALQALEQRLGAPVDEALGQPLVQRVAQLVLDGARPLLPVAASNRSQSER